VKRSLSEELARLRKHRGSKRRDLSIGEEVERVRKQAARRAGALGGLDEQWGELVPRELAGVSRPRRLTSGGVLTVQADDAAAMYELDQWLRGGGLAVLRGACGATLRSAKVVV
jgi:hypothetical protein